MRQLAVLGGAPASAREIPMNQPTLPKIEEVDGALADVLSSGQVTNHRYVRRVEEKAAEYLGVRHAVAVSSCTSGLILGIQALDLERPRVLVPSFTFPATAHAVTWNGLEPAFLDCEEDTFNVSLESMESRIDPRTGALVAVPIFGNPVQGRKIRAIADRRGLPVIYDAAHALGARHSGVPISEHADLAVFSLAPTKVVPAGEGGIVATNDDELARRLRIGRNYGNPGDYDCEFAGLNARMSEFHAVMALFGLERLDAAIVRRGELVSRYRGLLEGIPGVGFQQIRDGDRCTYNYFAISVEPDRFGLDVTELAQALRAENIGCRRYFYPPLHRQRIYAGKDMDAAGLEVTDRVADRVLCLPLFTHLEFEELDLVAEVVQEIQERAPVVRETLSSPVVRSVGGVR
ncbi:MAG: DegT/DnrJ/EryC1/StrS family aminotransferase [Acidobacteriota bacterium]